MHESNFTKFQFQRWLQLVFVRGIVLGHVLLLSLVHYHHDHQPSCDDRYDC